MSLSTTLAQRDLLPPDLGFTRDWRHQSCGCFAFAVGDYAIGR